LCISSVGCVVVEVSSGLDAEPFALALPASSSSSSSSSPASCVAAAPFASGLAFENCFLPLAASSSSSSSSSPEPSSPPSRILAAGWRTPAWRSRG
jgi:hypothetical protein